MREATKLYEEVFRGSISQCQAHFVTPRGEFTLVIDGKSTSEAASPVEAADRLRTLLRNGAPHREAREQVAAETGLPRREVYRMWLGMKDSAEAGP